MVDRIIKNNIYSIHNENTYLIDEKNTKYKVEFNNNLTYIYDSKPIDLINNLKYIKGFGTYRIELLNEDEIKTQSIINKIKDMI